MHSIRYITTKARMMVESLEIASNLYIPSRLYKTGAVPELHRELHSGLFKPTLKPTLKPTFNLCHYFTDLMRGVELLGFFKISLFCNTVLILVSRADTWGQT